MEFQSQRPKTENGDVSLSRRTFMQASAGSAALLATTEASQAAPKAQAAAAAFDPKPKPVTVEKTGSFFVGGRKVKGKGDFDLTKFPFPSKNLETFWVNQTYVKYQIPSNPRRFPIVFWHGGGLTGQQWESTPDGRPGFESIFLQNGFAVYTIDQAGRGRGNTPSFNGPVGDMDGTPVVPNRTVRFGIEGAWLRDRMGGVPGQYFPGSQFPKAGEENHFKGMGPQFLINNDEVVDSVVELFNRIGPAILVTHSASGITGFQAAIKSPNVKGIISYEPASGLFPQGMKVEAQHLPEGFGVRITEVPEAEFKKLSQIPIQLVFGDNIPSVSTPTLWMADYWRLIRLAQIQFVNAIKKNGGDASILDLPSVGLRGNTHFPMTDLNHHEVAKLLAKFLDEKKLSARA